MKNKISKQFQVKVRQFIHTSKDVLGENLRSIILFGSVARNRYSKWSDLDFCIIVGKRYGEREEFNLKLRIRELFGSHTDIVFREEREISDLLRINSSVDLDIINEGITVHGEDIISEYIALFNDVVRTNHLIHKPELGRGVWEYGY